MWLGSDVKSWMRDGKNDEEKTIRKMSPHDLFHQWKAKQRNQHLSDTKSSLQGHLLGFFDVWNRFDSTLFATKIPSCLGMLFALLWAASSGEYSGGVGWIYKAAKFLFWIWMDLRPFAAAAKEGASK